MYTFFMIILEQSMIYLPLTIGAYISFSLLKVPDLSLETAYLIGAFGGGLALQMFEGMSVPFVLIMTIAASMFGGILVGLTSSCITRFGKIPHLLSTIITFGLYQGLFLNCSNVYTSLAGYTNVLMGLPYVHYHPELMILIMINLIICMFTVVLLQTQLGYSFAIFGQNPEFFKHFKISTHYVFITGIAMANGFAGLAGFFFAQTNSLVEMNMGIGKGLFCITVLILGKAVFSRKNSIMIPISGIGLYFFMQQVLLKIGFNLKYFTAIQSLLILVVLLSIYKKNENKYDQLGV